jgi:hypothetical protein
MEGFCDFPPWRRRMLSRAAHIWDRAPRAPARSAYTRERWRTRARLRRLLTDLAEREDESCGSVGSGSCAQGLSHLSWAARRPPNAHRHRAAI